MLLLFLCYIIKVQAHTDNYTNKIFNFEPKIIGASNNKIKLEFSIGQSNIKVLQGYSNYKDITSELKYISLGNLYSYSVHDLYQQSINWKIYDFAGRENRCSTSLMISEPEVIDDACEALGCPTTFIGDNWCDAQCISAECGFDFEDCHEIDQYKAIGCDPSFIGNGVCNPECNNQIGFFDAGDCITECSRLGCDLKLLGNRICNKECFIEECHYDQGDCGNCSDGCSTSMLGDYNCDAACNNEACGYDLNDCDTQSCLETNCTIDMLTNDRCDPDCNNPYCNYDLGECISCAQTGCSISSLKNNICDLACFNQQCGYDGIDCVSDSCEDANCKTKDIGDGNCQTSCYHEVCAWDGGDCDKSFCALGCLPEMLIDNKCDFECNVPECGYDNNMCMENKQFCARECLNIWINDGICDAGCNNQECQYDGNDCDNIDSNFITNGVLQINGISYSASTECIRSSSYLISVSLIILIYT